jgi:hypothetical protein
VRPLIAALATFAAFFLYLVGRVGAYMESDSHWSGDIVFLIVVCAVIAIGTLGSWVLDRVRRR